MEPVKQLSPASVVPDDNQDYSKQEYWENRFKTEEQRDWLGEYKDFRDKFLARHPRLAANKENLRVLMLGCGNSTLSYDMYKDGFNNILSTDYSPTVIEKMRIKYKDVPELKWEVQDMKDMKSIQNSSFDLVFDKGALDAFMAEEGSAWSPDEKVLESVHASLKETRRVMAEGGVHVQITFQPSHFRKRYLGAKDPMDLSTFDVNDNIYGWKVSSQELGYGLGYSMFTCQL